MGAVARTLFTATVALLLAGPVAAADLTERLRQLLQARDQAAYFGRQILATRDGGRMRTLVVRVERDPAGWTRFTYRPLGTRGQVVILQRGEVQITYDPWRDLVRRSSLPRWDAFPAGDHIAWLGENYRLRAARGTMLGRQTLRLDLVPKVADRPRLRLEIDLQTGVFLRSERFSPDGRLGELSAFVHFEPRSPGWLRNLRVPRASKLIIDPTPQVIDEEEITARLGLRPLSVRPPAGFRHVTDLLVPGQKAAVQRVYSDGLSVLVIHQQRGSVPQPPSGSRRVWRAGGPVWVQRDGMRTVVHWSRGGWLLTATGDLTPEALLRMPEATGVDPSPRIVDHLLSWLRAIGLPL